MNTERLLKLNNSLELKVYLNEEIARLRSEVRRSLKLEEVFADEQMVEKTNQVLRLLEEFRHAEPTREVVTKILTIQELVREIKSND